MDRRTCLLNYNNASILGLFDKSPQVLLSFIISHVIKTGVCWNRFFFSDILLVKSFIII